MEELLEVLRVQRHNFLNHLQVISGLLQLKKYDRISEYIRQIGDNYNQESLVGRLESPEIVQAILTAELTVGKQGISIEKTITANLEKKIKDEHGTAEILKEMIVIAGSMAQKTGYDSEPTVELRVAETGDSYDFQVAVVSSGEESNLINQVGALKAKASQASCQVNSGLDEGKYIITLKTSLTEE